MDISVKTSYIKGITRQFSDSTAAAATAADVQAEPPLLTDTEASDILRKWGGSTTDLADLADLLG